MTLILRLANRWRLLVFLGSLLLVQGCSNCNILSGSHSLGCKTTLTGAAMSIAPAALANAAFEGARDGTSQRRERRLVQAGDPAATVTCVKRCDRYYKLDDAFDLQQLSADRVIEWWGTELPIEHVPDVMRAYVVRSGPLMKTDPASAESNLRRAASLAADPRMLAALTTRFPEMRYEDISEYDKLAKKAQQGLILLRYRGVPGRAGDPSGLSTSCRAVAAWPPAWYRSDAQRAKRDLSSICRLVQAHEEGLRLDRPDPVMGDEVIDPEPYER